jgi:hypothetical protein
MIGLLSDWLIWFSTPMEPLMPTLSKAQLIQPESPWGAAFDRMYLDLCQDRVRILTDLGFYAEHDLLPPQENSNAVPTQDEETELRQIASALTVAAAASEAMPTGVFVATLLKVSKNSHLFFARELPAPVEWARHSEHRGRHIVFVRLNIRDGSGTQR